MIVNSKHKKILLRMQTKMSKDVKYFAEVLRNNSKTEILQTEATYHNSQNRWRKSYCKHVPLLTSFDDAIKFKERYAKVNIIKVFTF